MCIKMNPKIEKLLNQVKYICIPEDTKTLEATFKQLVTLQERVPSVKWITK